MEQCPICGEDLGGANLICPHCGSALDEARARRGWLGLLRQRSGGNRRSARASRPSEPRRAAPKPQREQVPAPAATAGAEPRSVADPRLKRRRIWTILLTALLAIVLFASVIAAAAYAGVYAGERDREMRRATLLEEHYQAGIQALNDGRFERALAEFEYVLAAEPDHGLAMQGANEARARLEVKPTPTLEIAQSLAEQLLAQAQTAYNEKDWVAAARTLTQLRALDPAYEQEAVEQMLFESLYYAGQGYLEEEQLEVGISYLDQAIALRPIDAEVVAQRNLATRYLDALNFWGVDWDLCIQRFEALYISNPNYKDSAQRLYRAYIAYGDSFVQYGEMCPAEIQYTQALRMYADGTVEEKRATAAQACLLATPVPISGTVPLLTPQPIIGFSTGRLGYPVYNAVTGVYDLYALYADGRIIHIAASADQPSWEWSTGRIAYRDRTTGWLRMMLPEEGIPLNLLNGGQPAWPTLSPDSLRIAYAAPQADGTWGIYIANTNGTGDPQLMGNGWAPAWSRSGLIAYTGCTADGICGIILDNPDDDQPGRRLTASENDVAVSWSPAGNMMAYMSNVAGNWDLFLLSPEGGVQQLTSDVADEGLPAWSPDGSRMAFVSNRGGNWAIYTAELSSLSTGSGQINRVLDLGPSLPGWENQRLSWSP